ncbi:50S ribosomal protein L25 [Candidatus Saccharibacteria bacterium]|nr:50S ribosomal protein L25 [Candidatus Saccharibacteria bacterium]MCL1962991.1 50S ribosomal protein L25 [Candidatus Saccharibacteria bacterium]
MRDKIKLMLAKRDVAGKKVVQLRREGQVPAVVYGSEFEPQNVQFPQQEALRVVDKAGRHSPVELELDGKKNTALIKSISRAPAKRDITHISFQVVRADEVVHTEVPLVFVGEDESPAKRAGLIILPALEHISVKAKAADLPENIELDASKLTEHGEKLTLADAKVPKGVEIVDFDPEIVVATVYEPAALEAKNAAADAAADAERAEGADETAAESVPSEQESTEEKPAGE